MPSFLLRAQKMIQLGEGDVFDVFDFVRVWLNGEVWVANFVKENVVEFVFTPLVPPIGFGSIEDSGTAGYVSGHFTILIFFLETRPGIRAPGISSISSI